LDGDNECDPEDKGKVFFEKAKVRTNKEETKALTGSEHEKADIAPPHAGEAPHPTCLRARCLSPKLMSSKTAKAAGPNQASEVPLSTRVAHQVATHGQGHEVNTAVATDALLESLDPSTTSTWIHDGEPSCSQF